LGQFASQRLWLRLTPFNLWGTPDLAATVRQATLCVAVMRSRPGALHHTVRLQRLAAHFAALHGHGIHPLTILALVTRPRIPSAVAQ